MIRLKVKRAVEGFQLDVELEAPEERIIVLFGPSGAGKSAMLDAIAGWTNPDAGRIEIGGRVFFDSAAGIRLAPQARRVGMVRQDLALFPHLTAAENIGYGLAGEARAAREARVDELLQLTQLDGLGARRPGELSGGQQQRVALARALAIRPSLLLLDEPFSALDVPTRVELRQELRELQRHFRTSTLFVTHDPAEAHLMADLLAVMDGGMIRQFGTPDEVEMAPATARVAQIVGVRNILAATLKDAGTIQVGERVLEVERTSPPAPLLTQGEGRRTTSPPAPGKARGEGEPESLLGKERGVYAVIRQERITLVRRDFDPGRMPNVIAGRFVREEKDGSNVLLWFRANGERLNPGEEHDLLIDVPQYVYERLNVGEIKDWNVSLKPGVIHLVRRG